MTYQADRAHLARKHLDHQVSQIRPSVFNRPPKGWLRAVRDALGLTTRQLAARMGRSQPSITALEKNELSEAITLKSLREAAAALDCQLVYALVPNAPLETTVMQQARSLAAARMIRLNHTMSLEDQALQPPEQATELERLTEQILRAGGSRLWAEG